MDTNKSDNYDLLIIGGGIVGAGVAQAASAAGYRVLLLEKFGFGSQTSSHSSKLIHGGLRYLETAQFGLVRDSLTQRHSLLELAPSLVKPIPFYIPVYDDSRRGSWIIGAGLLLYSVLANFRKFSRFKRLPKSSWKDLDGLKQQGLKSVFEYWDAQTDDKLLTNAVIRSARSLGAKALCPANFESASKNDSGYQVNYSSDGMPRTCQTHCIINAAGPWVNKVAETITPEFKAPRIDWVKGSHLILKQPAPDHVYYLESILGQRVILVIPWYGKTMIGTTEVEIKDLDTEVTTTAEEIDYLLTNYQHYFPDSNIEIESTFSGVRVLPANTKAAFNRSRESKLWSPKTHPNLRMIYGGKLTTFRTIAKEMVEWLEQRIGKRDQLADIDKLEIN